MVHGEVCGMTDSKTIIPLYLKGIKTIARTFGVSREKVREWIRRGMPCSNHSGRYDGDYHRILAWLEQKFPAD